MTDFEIGLLSGVISGLLTSALTLLLGAYWKDTLRPWIEDLLYRGARIAGTWKCEVRIHEEIKSQQVVVHQRAHRIWGTIAYPEDTKGHSHTYTFEGSFFNNVLTALAEEKGKARVDRGAIMLTLQPGLAEVVMTGVGVWLDGSEPIPLDFTWTQQASAT